MMRSAESGAPLSMQKLRQTQSMMQSRRSENAMLATVSRLRRLLRKADLATKCVRVMGGDLGILHRKRGREGRWQKSDCRSGAMCCDYSGVPPAMQCWTDPL